MFYCQYGWLYIELSRLMYDNDLLQRNVTIVRDENDLFRDTTESYKSKWKNAKLNLTFGIRLKKSAQKRKTSHNQKRIRYLLIPGPI